MAYITPKESWVAGDAPLPNDLNRIEGNTRANHEGIGIEAAARLAADQQEVIDRNSAITGAINSEAATRLANDNAESTARYNDDVAEANARAAADTAEYNARIAADSAEALTRGNADTAELNARVAADGAESGARIAADNALAAGGFVIENRSDDPVGAAVGHMWIRIDL